MRTEAEHTLERERPETSGYEPFERERERAGEGALRAREREGELTRGSKRRLFSTVTYVKKGFAFA